MIHKFTADIKIIGINPYVTVPPGILEAVFKKAGKDKGPIPVHGKLNRQPYKQNLMKYLGEWRLYVNTTMLKNSPKRIGETVTITIAFDKADRSIAPHPALVKALRANKRAKAVFDSLRPSLQHEVVRYIAALKTQGSVDRNIIKAIDFLLGKGRFVGRDGVK